MQRLKDQHAAESRAMRAEARLAAALESDKRQRQHHETAAASWSKERAAMSEALEAARAEHRNSMAGLQRELRLARDALREERQRSNTLVRQIKSNTAMLTRLESIESSLQREDLGRAAQRSSRPTSHRAAAARPPARQQRPHTAGPEIRHEQGGPAATNASDGPNMEGRQEMPERSGDPGVESEEAAAGGVDTGPAKTLQLEGGADAVGERDTLADGDVVVLVPTPEPTIPPSRASSAIAASTSRVAAPRVGNGVSTPPQKQPPWSAHPADAVDTITAQVQAAIAAAADQVARAGASGGSPGGSWYGENAANASPRKLGGWSSARHSGRTRTGSALETVRLTTRHRSDVDRSMQQHRAGHRPSTATGGTSTATWGASMSPRPSSGFGTAARGRLVLGGGFTVNRKSVMELREKEAGPGTHFAGVTPDGSQNDPGPRRRPSSRGYGYETRR